MNPTSTSGPPVFVVGCQRSGTTLVRLLLDSHSRISCGPETRYLTNLAPLVDQEWPRLQRYGLSQDEWLARIRTLFAGVHADYAAGRGKARWADKSPQYALILPFVLRLFPDALVVHVVRDGRDVAVSHRERFGLVAGLHATWKWPKYVRAVRSVAATLPPEQFHELRYEDLVRDQEGTVRRLTDFLGEQFEPQMLRIDDHQHDVPDRYHEQARRRRQAQGTSGSVYSGRAGAHRRELDPLTRLLVRVLAGRTLRELGYR